MTTDVLTRETVCPELTGGAGRPASQPWATPDHAAEGAATPGCFFREPGLVRHTRRLLAAWRLA